MCLTGELAASSWLGPFDSFPPPLMRLILPGLLLTTVACFRFDWHSCFRLSDYLSSCS